MPVLVLDEDCRKCEYLDIVSETVSRIYADCECIEQEIRIRCKDMDRCQRLLKRLKKNEG